MPASTLQPVDLPARLNHDMQPSFLSSWFLGSRRKRELSGDFIEGMGVTDDYLRSTGGGGGGRLKVLSAVLGPTWDI